jgi:hypothetical protein
VASALTAFAEGRRAIPEIGERQREARLGLCVVGTRCSERVRPDRQGAFVMLARSQVIASTCLEVSVEGKSGRVVRCVGCLEAFPDPDRACSLPPGHAWSDHLQQRG